MSKVKIKMKTRAAGPTFNASPGDIVSLEEKQADDMVKGGYAEYVLVESVPETASPEEETKEEEKAPEKPPAKRRGRGRRQ